MKKLIKKAAPNRARCQLTRFRPRIRSRHPSHSVLRRELALMPFRSIIRLGSTTVDATPGLVELNSVQSIKNSSSKLLMKHKFTEARIKTADWYIYQQNRGFTSQIDNRSYSTEHLPYPIVAKSHQGSRGRGNTLLKTQQELENWMRGKTMGNYIFEKFYNYGLEYRLHITNQGCFYACRKALKADCPEDQKWRHHDDNCVWYMENNPSFNKPASWNDIIRNCVNALNSLGLDIGCFDVKVQSAQDNRGRGRQYQDFIILESNSAPSFGDVTARKYLEEIPKVLTAKFNNR